MADDQNETPQVVSFPEPRVGAARDAEERRRVAEIAREIEELGRALEGRDRASRLATEGGSPTRRRKWGPLPAVVIIVLSLVSGGALMLMGAPIEMRDAYRSAVAEMQRLTARENAETEAAARKAAEGKPLAVEAEREAAEEKLAGVGAGRRPGGEGRAAGGGEAK